MKIGFVVDPRDPGRREKIVKCLPWPRESSLGLAMLALTRSSEKCVWLTFFEGGNAVLNQRCRL